MRSPSVQLPAFGMNARARSSTPSRVLRARAIAARHAFLVRELLIEAKDVGLQGYMSFDRSIILRRCDERESGTFVLPAAGVPDAERYEMLERLMRRETEAGRSYVTPPYLLYDESGIRARWLEHLNWLNGNIASVRSVGLREAKDWLRTVVEGRPPR